ncbi:MAG: hypothetical protein U1E62_08770 [Alsobacter sp.]
MIRAVISDRSGTRVTTVPTWAVGLGAFGLAVLGVILFIIGAGLALVLAPVAIGAVLVARWRLKSMLRDLAARAEMVQARQGSAGNGRAAGPSDPSVIEGDFRVIDPGKT